MSLKKIGAFVLALAFSFITFFVPAADVNSAVLDCITESKITGVSESGYMDIDYIVPSVENSSYLKKGEELPQKYDSRLENCITSVKNQGNTSACWAFGAMGASEASLIKTRGYDKNDIDLSELHLAYYTYNDAYDAHGFLQGDKSSVHGGFLSTGGIHYVSALSLARWTGVVDEKEHDEFSFANAKNDFKVVDNQKAYNYNEALLENAYWISMTDKDDIKAMIMKYGAGVLGYYQDEDNKYFNEAEDSYCCIQETEYGSYGYKYANHEVVICGWDDNYSASNFNSISRPENNGAWLIKNSWGEDKCDDGYFWLSYEDSSIQHEDAGFFEYTSTNKYNCNYQYDGSLNPTANYSDGKDMENGGYEGGGYISNSFIAQDYDYLNAVSFVTLDTNVNYSINIYLNLSVKSNPLSGEKVFSYPIQGTATYAGYHTVELPSSVLLSKGERFAVVIRMYKDVGERVKLACDMSDENLWIDYTSSAFSNQSFFSKDGLSWKDVSKEHQINFRIKAFSSRFKVSEDYDKIVFADGISLNRSSISLTEGNTAAFEATVTPEDATDKVVIWTSSNTKAAIVSQSGRITAIHEGKAVITAKTRDGGYSASCTVTVKPYNGVEDPISSDMMGANTVTIDKALTMEEATEVTVIGQVVYMYSPGATGQKVNVIIEDVIDGDIVGMLVYDWDSGFEYREGQIVEISGAVSLYRSQKQLVGISEVKLIKESDEVIQPQEVTIGRLREKPEKFVGEYIVLANAKVNNYVADGCTSVDDGTGTMDIYNAAPYPTGVRDGDTVDLYCAFSLYGTVYQLRVGSSSCYVKYTEDDLISFKPDTDSDSDITDSEPEEILYGDADGNNDVNMLDVVLMQKVIAKLEAFDNKAEKRADVNADSKVNMVDVTLVQKYIAKLISKFEADIINTQ